MKISEISERYCSRLLKFLQWLATISTSSAKARSHLTKLLFLTLITAVYAGPTKAVDCAGSYAFFTDVLLDNVADKNNKLISDSAQLALSMLPVCMLVEKEYGISGAAFDFGNIYILSDTDDKKSMEKIAQGACPLTKISGFDTAGNQRFKMYVSPSSEWVKPKDPLDLRKMNSTWEFTCNQGILMYLFRQ